MHGKIFILYKKLLIGQHTESGDFSETKKLTVLKELQNISLEFV